MNVVVAVAVGVLFGAGVYLLLRRDVVRVAAGTLLISNAAVLLLVAAGFQGGRKAPLGPGLDPAAVADPLVQALALTAVVIGFGTTVLLLRVLLAVERSHGALDTAALAAAETAGGDDAARPDEGRPDERRPDEDRRADAAHGPRTGDPP